MTNPEIKLTRAQRLINYMTNKLCLTLPIENDDDVPSASVMAPGVGMSVRETAETMSLLRRHKPSLLPNPKPENSLRRNSVSVSRARGGKWLVLERYSFMAPEEAHFALLDKLGEEKVMDMGLNIDSVRRVIAKHSRAGHIKHTDEERESIHRTILEPKDVKRGRVIFWTQVMDILDQQGIRRPDNRLVWMDIWQRAQDVNDGVGKVLERLAQGQRLHFVTQQILEREIEISENSLSAHIRNNFVADEVDMKVFKEFEETIKRVNSMPLTLAEKERLFRCLFWEEKGAEVYAKFFIVPSNKLRKDLGQLIDDAEELRLMYDTLPA